MLNVIQSLLHPDQYRFGIKPPVLLYSLSTITLTQQLTKTQITTMIITTIQLETALCYQNYFCNTELRTAIITEIKGLLIQTQQNMFVLFTLFKLTVDERKTLTKISMCKTSHNHSPKQAHASDTKEQENQQTAKGRNKRRKGRLHNWWRIQSFRISSRNNGRIKKTSRLVLYQTLHYFVPD